MRESGQDRKSANQFINSRAASSSSITFRFPQSLSVDESATSPSELSARGINRDLSPTPIDLNRINIVDELPLESLLMSHDEASAEMLISLLKESLLPASFIIFVVRM